MSKELEAYFKIDHTLCLNSQNIKFGMDADEHIDCQNVDELVNCLETIKNALEEREAINNVNPSEALECLERLDKEYASIESDDFDNCFNTIKQALLELKSIKEAEPSEALRELSIIRHLEIGFDKNGNAVTVGDCNGIEVIKQALLKTQEPKQYLKWEDLEFTNKVKEMKVKLGDNTYEIEYYISNALDLPQPVVILKTSDFIAITIEQFFNDLHLERVEE